MSESREEIERRYREMGYETRHVIDAPGTVYALHKHKGVRLFTLKGSAMVKLDDGPWQTIEAGQELVIQDEQLHEAKVAEEGWEYVFAATLEELRRQGLE